MAVVKSRMLPGEVIEVRSPNATAAVRGIVFVVEVDPVSAGQPSVAQITTRAHLFHGALDVSARLDPARPTVRLAELQSVVVTGNALGAIQPISRDAVAALTADLKPRQIQAPDAPIDFTSGLMAREQGRAVALATQLLTPVPNNPVQGTLKTVKGTVTTVTGSTAQVLAQLMNGLGDPAGATTLVKGVGDTLGSTVNGTVGGLSQGLGGALGGATGGLGVAGGGGLGGIKTGSVAGLPALPSLPSLPAVPTLSAVQVVLPVAGPNQQSPLGQLLSPVLGH